MASNRVQNSLFEEDYLLRELGQVAHVPQVALTELVANAWDAGASKVELQLPAELDGVLTVTDDGHGMTPGHFVKRWMTLRYNRLKYQGADVEFPGGRAGSRRRAYGRNGVGRHGLLCFNDEYEVETWRDGKLTTFVVGTESGPSPFVLRSQVPGERAGSGTRLAVRVRRALPDADEILTVLATRFVHDPKFEICVNGKTRSFDEIEGRISETPLDLGSARKATVIVIDSTRVNHSATHQGIAFWVGRRLVGTPCWAVGSVANFDGRTRFARRYKVIVDTQGFESDVEQDWTGFRNTDEVRHLFARTAECIKEVALQIAADTVEDSSEDALTENRVALAVLGRGAQQEVTEFTKAIALAHPTVSPEFLSAAVSAVINLEKSKSGAALLQKLAMLPADDIPGLDRLLEEWTVKDALRVLDEIDNRLSVIETIRRLAGDPETDELHTLHPLVLRSRWLFGPEFESAEYRSNATLKTIARDLFKSGDAQFINDRNRPDIVVLPDMTTVQLSGVEYFDPADPEIAQMQHVLIIELKKGGSKLTRNEVNQADGYVQDMVASGVIAGTPFISAWVVGQTIAAGVAKDKSFEDNGRKYGRLRATTFDTLVDSANLRLFRLREHLSSRYGDIPPDRLLAKVLAKPLQLPLANN